MTSAKSILKTALNSFRGNHKHWQFPWLPNNFEIRNEAQVHPHVAAEKADLFHAYNTGTTEIEVLNWLFATVMLLKPQTIVETGAANGVGTIALAMACKANGFGTVHCVELDQELCEASRERLETLKLSGFAEVHCSDSFEYLRSAPHIFDIGFFDSMCEIRVEEYRILRRKGAIRRLAVFHDTSALRCKSLEGWPSKEEHDQFRADLFACGDDPAVEGLIESRLSRGHISIWLDEDKSAEGYSDWKTI